MELDDSIRRLSGVGEAGAKLLSKLSIHTVGDLIFHIPRSYQDYSQVATIATMKPGPVTLKGQFTSVSARYARRGLHVTSALFNDGTGTFRITWFKQPWRKASLPLHQAVYVSGELKLSKTRFSIINPAYELAEDIQLHTARIVPVYKRTEGITSAKLRSLLATALPRVHLGGYSPADLFATDPDQMIKQIHFPDSAARLNQAIRQWQFLDLFEYVLVGFLLRQKLLKHTSPAIAVDDSNFESALQQLPYVLTAAQRRATTEIMQDLERPQPMNRLLQGDVGSGKTVTALLAAQAVLQAGYQVAMVAPTEIVAKQHLTESQKLLAEFKPKLLSSSLTARQKSGLKNKLATGDQCLVIGTHAVLQPDVTFNNLGLIVLDEQHRFGVKQRQTLTKQSGQKAPHVLSMTATPIPRTLALTVFSDLDVSVIDELPPGRKPVETKIGGPRTRPHAYKRMEEELKNGHQIYVVCPLISESDVLGATSVGQELEKLQSHFTQAIIRPLHGALTREEKDATIIEFTAKKVDILVATTVVEVGVNVPNATVMLIEGAERFGLAQLHQLRGRVGRAEDQSYCIALASQSGQAKERLEAFAATTDGFKLAELDLQQRGSGELYGLRQSGFIDLDTSVMGNSQMISRVRQLASQFVADYTVDNYPLLQYRLGRIQHTANRN